MTDFLISDLMSCPIFSIFCQFATFKQILIQVRLNIESAVIYKHEMAIAKIGISAIKRPKCIFSNI